MLPYLNNVCLALALVSSERAGVVTHRITCGLATPTPTLLVVQQEDQQVVEPTRGANEGPCAVTYLSTVAPWLTHSYACRCIATSDSCIHCYGGEGMAYSVCYH